MPLDFDAWMAAVDDHLDRLVGATSADLPDCLYRDWYAAGMTPAEAAREAVKNAD